MTICLYPLVQTATDVRWKLDLYVISPLLYVQRLPRIRIADASGQFGMEAADWLLQTTSIRARYS